MDVIQSVILGALQGLTEFIPVSSSGHLVIAQNFLNGISNHTFLELINIGTLLALLIFFRKKILVIIKDIFLNKKYRLALNILLTSVPAGLAGYLLSGFISDNSFFSSITVVVVALIVLGVVMLIIDKLPHASPVKTGEELPWHRALAIGFAQMLALVPGVSRSGSTIIAGRLSGLPHKEAAEYSFLASIPIMLAVALKNFVSSSDREYLMSNLPMLLISNIVACIAGLLAVKLLLKYLSNHDLKIFGWYRLILATIVLVVLLLQ